MKSPENFGFRDFFAVIRERNGRRKRLRENGGWATVTENVVRFCTKRLILEKELTERENLVIIDKKRDWKRFR
jgi:hypothetical protein